MYKLAALAAVAAAIALPTSLTTSAQAGTRVTVSPVYVPAVYCSYKSKDWYQKGIVSCPMNWAPIGNIGTKWKTAGGGLMCWRSNTFAGREFAGWWAACPKPK
jgi:hypothetical protein